MKQPKFRGYIIYWNEKVGDQTVRKNVFRKQEKLADQKVKELVKGGYEGVRKLTTDQLIWCPSCLKVVEFDQRTEGEQPEITIIKTCKECQKDIPKE